MRPKWKGKLKLSLVEVPVRLLSASESTETIKFHRLHASCLGRTQSKAWCGVCNVELVCGSDTVRGYEHRKGEHVVVSDEELEALHEDATHALTITSVVSGPVDPIYIDSVAYLVPDGTTAEPAFDTLRVALGAKLAIGMVVLAGKATRVALDAVAHGFIVYVLRPHARVRQIAEVRQGLAVRHPAKAEVAMATQLFGAIAQAGVDYSSVKDEYAERVKALVAAKIAGQVPPVPAKATTIGTTLTQALQASLAAAGRAGPTVVPHRKKAS